jgi:hypothetical protein
VCYTVIFNSSVLRKCWGLVVLSAESLLITTSGINWYWLEPGLLTSSQKGLRPQNPFFSCSKHRWSMVMRPLFLEIRPCIFGFGVRSFVLQDSEIGCRRESYGYNSFLIAAPPPHSSVASIRRTVFSLSVTVGAIRIF